MNSTQSLATKQAGLGEPASGSWLPGAAIGLAAAGAGAYGGYLVGKRVTSKKNRTAGEIIGAIAGFVIVPTAVGTVLGVFK